ncbi:MAG: 16S rRNA (cytosine(1402)-N(4))-methyltransferase, partial [Alteraurantiacibacter sp.]
LNEAEADTIADVLYRYGEERQSRRVARAIVAARPLETTGQLAEIVRKALGFRPGDKKDPATRSFQAIRIHVNGELDELDAALKASETLLKAGGKLAVVSFHSLEDRIVKTFLRDAANQTPRGSRHLPEAQLPPSPRFGHLTKAIRAGAAETARNPRARSATLRGATRTDALARETAA